MDLICLPVEVDKKKFDGRYRLVVAASRRARALYQGATPTIASKAKKLTTLALEEVISDKVQVLTGEAAVKARAEAMKLTSESMMDEAKQKEAIPEDLTEIEKDLKVYLKKKSERESKQSADAFFSEEGSE
ncbi:MAG: DNA-directed RNA polymerase subunit omega [Nitrospirae bacterium]|nr:DNA-directed RNA polymerase subunit omega [Nitrospirota bacterium]